MLYLFMDKLNKTGIKKKTPIKQGNQNKTEPNYNSNTGKILSEQKSK